jgi:predicted NBD/HSP70 family sugar kinase
LLEAAQSDPAATTVLDQGIEALGAALGSIVNLSNPQRIVIGGWVGLRLMEQHSAQILAAVRRNCLARAGEQFDLQPASFGGDTVALGSALMPIEALIQSPRK